MAKGLDLGGAGPGKDPASPKWSPQVPAEAPWVSTNPPPPPPPSQSHLHPLVPTSIPSRPSLLLLPPAPFSSTPPPHSAPPQPNPFLLLPFLPHPRLSQPTLFYSHQPESLPQLFLSFLLHLNPKPALILSSSPSCLRPPSPPSPSSTLLLLLIHPSYFFIRSLNKHSWRPLQAQAPSTKRVRSHPAFSSFMGWRGTDLRSR